MNEVNTSKNLLKLFVVIGIILFFIILLACAIAASFVYMESRSPTSLKDGTIFTIEQGDTIREVAKRLEIQGCIKNSLLFEFLMRLPLTNMQIKVGTYKLSEGMDTFTLIDKFVKGEQLLIKVTVPEGYTVRQIAQVFYDKAQVSDKEFMRAATDKELLSEFSIPLKSAEGYLYPDTYNIPLGYNAKALVKLMISRFFEVVYEIAPEAKEYNPKELSERVILASIVEREYRAESEAPRIAGVFYNRIKKGMALQSCATVVYIITEIQGKAHPERLFFTDTEMDNPYNTYVYRNLPPGAISNPGKTALNSVFHPEPSEYLYFRLIDEAAGKHQFSVTFDEHNNAGLLILKKQAN